MDSEAMQPGGKKAGPITMEMVARIAGVSQVSVSRALNHPEKVAPATLARINEAIRATGFVPNLVAGALASRRSGIIAALIPSITNITYSSFLRPFIEAMRQAGYQIILAETGFDEQEEAAMVQNLLSRQPEGILLTGVNHSPDCRRMLLGAGLPVVEVWDTSESPIDISVGFSHVETGRAMARFAWQRGYRQAGVLTAPDQRALRRKDAFCSEFIALGGAAPVEHVCEGSASIKNGREGLAGLMRNGFTSGVIQCSSDLFAHGVLIEAQARSLKVPGDVAVIGFGDMDFAAHTVPKLTTVRVDRDVLGHTAADALLKRIGGHRLTDSTIDVGFKVIGRQSA
ncbi:LacI family DNA-binding transcriptional regulator [Hoeflea marina]|nr:LacI family DNA-binding transcriptional regulator [Hoeflea marina]